MEHNTHIGVIIGRFQVAELHEGHTHLVNYALRENDKVVVVLGSGATLLTARNPLPYEMRVRVVQESFPDVSVLKHDDHPSDAIWSERLDALLRQAFPDATIKLYASRDSFLPYYSGTLPVIVVPMLDGISGTTSRASAAAVHCNASFRYGMIAAQQLRPALSYQTVDIAVIRQPELEILLGQKETDGDQWRLIGGFVDATDMSLEAAATRELREEAGNLMTHELNYIGSFRVSDWRYRSESDKVLTALFATYHMGGSPTAGDDLARVAWHPLSIDPGRIVEAHRPLIKSVSETVFSSR